MTQVAEKIVKLGSINEPTIRPISVCICLPTCGAMEPMTATNIAALCAYSSVQGIQTLVANQDTTGIAKNRNSLCQTTLDTGADYMLFIDSDMIFPANMLVRLLAHKREIIGVPYPRRGPPFSMLGMPLEPGKDQSGVVEFEFLPTGLLLISTEVLRTIRWPWFYESYQYQGDTEAEKAALAIADLLRIHELPAAFKQQIADVIIEGWTSQDVSEDINFCRKARRYGYKIWGELDICREIGHIGTQIVRVG